MNENLRQALEVRRDEDIREAANRLLADANADIAESLRRIEAYSKLLDAMKPPPPRQWGWSIGLAACCVILAGLLWSLRVSTTKLVLKIQSDAVTMTLAAPWSLPAELPLGASPIRLEGLTTLEAPALGLAIESPQSESWIQLEASEVSITRLGLAQDGVLIIERKPSGQLEVYARGREFQGQLMVLGSVHLTAGRETADPGRQSRYELTVPEAIAFRAIGNKAVPTRFTVRSRTSWRIQGLQVNGLGFSREIAHGPGSVTFESAIKEGTITLPDVAKTEHLRENDPLFLRGVDGRVVDLRIGDAINVISEGTAAQIQVGPEGFAQNLVPTYLQYLYHQQSLAFFWSAVLFFWGLLWSVRKTLFP